MQKNDKEYEIVGERYWNFLYYSSWKSTTYMTVASNAHASTNLTDFEAGFRGTIPSDLCQNWQVAQLNLSCNHLHLSPNFRFALIIACPVGYCLSRFWSAECTQPSSGQICNINSSFGFLWLSINTPLQFSEVTLQMHCLSISSSAAAPTILNKVACSSHQVGVQLIVTVGVQLAWKTYTTKSMPFRDFGTASDCSKTSRQKPS